MDHNNITIFQSMAKKYTDFVFATDIKGIIMHAGSCVHCKMDKKQFLATCAHVVQDGFYYFSAIPRVKAPFAPCYYSSKQSVVSINSIYRDMELDIALLDGKDLNLENAQKQAYDLSFSKEVTLNTLKNSKEFYIYGLWGTYVKDYTYPDNNKYTECPLYTGMVTLHSICNDEIVVDATECKIAYKSNSNIFEELNNLKDVCAKRNLKGVSGSGLWLKKDEDILYVGMLIGPNKREDKHLIRFSPVWKIINAISRCNI